MDGSHSHLPSPTGPNNIKDNISVMYFNARSLIHKVDELCANCLNHV